MRALKPYRLLILATALSMLGCGTKEEITPIYKTEALSLNDANIQFWTSIPMEKLDPSPVRSVTRAIIGWVPIAGDLIELPMNLVNVVFPKLSVPIHPKLTGEQEWNDPALLASLKSIRIGAGYIRITPENERGPNYEPEMCYFTLRCLFKGECKCRDLTFKDFMSEIRVYLQFKDLKSAESLEAQAAQQSEFSELGIDEKRRNEPEVFLAAADVESSYDEATRTLHFNVSDENIRKYMNLYDRFEIKLIAAAKYPRRAVYIDGRLRVDLIMGLQ